MIRQALAAMAMAGVIPCASAAPAAPQPGLWWSPSESGRGYAIDSQGELMVVTTFAYDSTGRMQWYISSGPFSNGGYHFSAPLLKYDLGQPLNGAYRAPTAAGNDGTLTLDFSSRVTGTLTLPGGRQVAIQRQNFGVGDTPSALLGQWLFAYSIGSITFADRFHYTTVGNSTTTGNGVAVDATSIAAAEYQVSGTFAGSVVGFQYTSTGTVTNQYVWQLQMEEGRGSWVSPTTFNQYGMNVYKTATAGGTSKAGGANARDVLAKGVMREPESVSLEELSARDPEIGALASRMWDEVSRANNR